MRRDRLRIWSDILDAVQTVGEHGSPSRVRSRANLPHDRFWRHVSDLTDRGLLEEDPLRATPEGQRFLDATQALEDLLQEPR